MSLTNLPPGSIVAVDTEGSSLHWDPGVGLPTTDGRVSVVSFAYRQNGVLRSGALPFDQGPTSPIGDKDIPPNHRKRMLRWPEEQREEVVPNLGSNVFQQLCETLSQHRLVMHHVKHDLHHLREGLRGGHGGLDLSRSGYWCTMLTQRIIEPAMPVGLKPTAVRLSLLGGGEDADQEALKPWLGPTTGKNADPRYDLVPWSIMEPYAALDAELTYLLWEWQASRVAASGQLQGWREDDLALMHTLYGMEKRGIRFDKSACDQSARQIRAEKQRLADSIPFEGGTGNPTPAAARRFFFTDAGRPPYPGKVTDGGQPQVDDDVVARLVADGVEYADLYQQHETAKSALSKWYEPWAKLVGDDGRLRTIYRQGHVVSGRLAANRCNLLAIPHKWHLPDLPGMVPVRGLFGATVGCRLWEADVSQAEVRIAAVVSDCKPMLDRLAAGDDSHSAVAKAMFGADESHEEWTQYRSLAKRLNLAILYGAGPKRLRDEILAWMGQEVSMRQAAEYIAQWKASLPELANSIALAEQKADQLGYVTLLGGRQRWLADYEPSYKAFNQLCQGSLAVAMNRAMPDINARWPGALLLQIHDSLVFELPKGQPPEAIAHALSRHFEEAFGGKVAFPVDVKEWSAED